MSEEIFSSTGALGTSTRQDGRLYHNAEVFSADVGEISETFDGLAAEARDDPDISRAVWRGAVSDRAMRDIKTGPLAGNVEVALPLEEFSRPGWLLYLARNDEARGPTPPIIEIRRQTAPGSYRPARHTPLQRVERVLAAGNEIRTELDDDSYAELHELWGPTFGWRRDEEEDNITAFAERLQSEQAMPESERTTWFAATYSGGLLVSAAMAERLEIPGPDGPLDLVESTEWCTRPGEDYRGHGFMAATLTAINAQVLHSLRDSPRGQPLIYAETNFTARSDRAGHAVGLRIPSREYARQILAQNVTVADGIATAGLRDFSFMYLAEQIRALHYDTEQTGRLISALEAGVRA